MNNKKVLLHFDYTLIDHFRTGSHIFKLEKDVFYGVVYSYLDRLDHDVGLVCSGNEGNSKHILTES